MNTDPRALERKILTHWKRLAPVIHAHFALSAPERQEALQSARHHPLRALHCYMAIARTLVKR